MERLGRPEIQPGENLSLRPGTHIDASVSHPTGGGARQPRILLNDSANDLDGRPLSAFEHRNTFDTYDGQNHAEGPDWYAISFPDHMLVNCVEMTMGFAHYNGGWWASLDVQSMDAEGHWHAVQGLTITPPYCFEDCRGERRPYETYELTFVAVHTRGLRLIGQAGGLAEFTSLARIAVYHRDMSRRRSARYLSSAPIPELFRVISPAVVWDLSAGLSKVTGLMINLPLMEFYLDAARYEQCWRALRRTYQGEPELWFLIGDSIGWDVWTAIDAAGGDKGSAAAPDPYVRFTLGDSLAHAVAPVQVAGRLVGELSSHAVIVRDHFDWSWHKRFAREHHIPWNAYRAAVERSPQLTTEQLSGVAALMGLIANTVATLAYRLQRAEQDLEHRATTQQHAVLQAIDYMRDHLEEAIGVTDIARAVALSPHYFGNLFTDQTGLTPNEFLTNLRIERAKEYLTHTQMSPTDVCLRLGYSSSYFWRLFKRRTGYTPAGFARQARAVRPIG